jgi:hypothetical protein
VVAPVNTSPKDIKPVVEVGGKSEFDRRHITKDERIEAQFWYHVITGHKSIFYMCISVIKKYKTYKPDKHEFHFSLRVVTKDIWDVDQQFQFRVVII